MDNARIRRGAIVTSDSARVDLVRRRKVLFYLAAALAVMAAILALLSDWISDAARERSGATSFNFAGAGFRAFFDLAEARGHRPSRFKRAYVTLPDPAAHALVIAAPGIGRDDAAPVRTADLFKWVERGGRVLVALRGPSVGRIGTVNDTIQEEQALGDIARDRPLLTPAALDATWIGQGALDGRKFTFRAVDDRVQGLGRRYLWTAGAELGAFDLDEPNVDQLILVEERADGGRGVLAYEHAIGKGAVVFLSSAYPLSNAALRFGGTGSLAAAMLDAIALDADGSRRSVLFDERTHGIGESVGLFGFFVQRPALWITLTVALGALMLAWYGAVRLGRPLSPRDVPRRAREEFVVSMADLYARRSCEDVALDRVLAGYEDRIRRASGRRHETGAASGATTPEIDAMRRVAATAQPRSTTRLTEAAAELHEIFEAGMAAVKGRGYTAKTDEGPAVEESPRRA